MMESCKKLGRLFLTATIIFLALPFLTYLLPSGGKAEQAWLDQMITHLEVMREHCDDPDLQEILDYTIRRYHWIGPVGVGVQNRPAAYGTNAPWVPGVTLDPALMEYPIEFSAVVLVHEALHSYFPYFGHFHITERERKLHDLSQRTRRNRNESETFDTERVSQRHQSQGRRRPQP